MKICKIISFVMIFLLTLALMVSCDFVTNSPTTLTNHDSNSFYNTETKTDNPDETTSTHAEETTSTHAHESKAETTEETTTKATDNVESIVWIPTNGGKKYHCKSSCSQMKNPLQTTKEEAINQGFEPCGRCY